MSKTTHTIQTGLEVFLQDGLPQLQGQRVGLVTNYSGVDTRLRTTVDLLAADKRIHLSALFGPEHGIRGDAQAGVEVGSSTDQRTGLPVHSLYGQTHRPGAEMLQGLDALIYDIQDAGARYYTYLATLAYAQEAAAEAGLTFVVLDRPNPITGSHSEGNILDPNFASLVGIHPLPIRHGLTVGELACLFAAERDCPPPLVVPMRGWQRSYWFDEIDLPWIYPSPNLPTLDSLTLYPGTCLLEGTNLSEGRGTTRPFELIGAPWLDPYALQVALEQLDLPGVAFRPAYFTPTFSKHAQTLCKGVQIHITDRESLRPVELGLHLLATLRRLQPDAFTWITSSNNRYFVDRLFGSDQLRLALDNGADVSDWSASWDAGLAEFKERSHSHLLYA